MSILRLIFALTELLVALFCAAAKLLVPVAIIALLLGLLGGGGILAWMLLGWAALFWLPVTVLLIWGVGSAVYWLIGPSEDSRFVIGICKATSSGDAGASV